MASFKNTQKHIFSFSREGQRPRVWRELFFLIFLHGISLFARSEESVQNDSGPWTSQQLVKNTLEKVH
jgi:hypothetical protein